MGWNIGIKTNTLKMSMDVADKLVEAAQENYQSISYSETYGLEFDYDAMEHKDFLWEDWALDALNDPSVNGDVVFMSAEGDNRGEIWGYRFKNGVPYILEPVVTFNEIPVTVYREVPQHND